MSVSKQQRIGKLTNMKGTALFTLCALALTAAKPREKVVLRNADIVCAQENAEGDLLAHENCDRFYKCNGGKSVALDCPDGLMYNIDAQYCDWASNVACGERTISEKEEAGEDNGTEEGGSGPQINGYDDPSQAPAICAAEGSDGVLIAHENCAQFYKCFGGRPMTLECPASLLYQPALEYCDWPENVVCGDRASVNVIENKADVLSDAGNACAKVNSEGALVAHENCDRFYKCSGGKPVALDCPTGLLYNIDAEYCDWASNVACGERTISGNEEASEGNVSDDGGYKPALNGNGDPSQAPSICAAAGSDGVLVAHENCNQFYKCSLGVPVALDCPASLLYHYELEICDWPQNVVCGTRNM